MEFIDEEKRRRNLAFVYFKETIEKGGRGKLNNDKNDWIGF